MEIPPCPPVNAASRMSGAKREIPIFYHASVHPAIPIPLNAAKQGKLDEVSADLQRGGVPLSDVLHAIHCIITDNEAERAMRALSASNVLKM